MKNRYIKEMVQQERLRAFQRKQEEKERRKINQLLKAIQCILKHTSVEEEVYRNGLCLDIAKLYFIKVDRDNFQIDQNTYSELQRFLEIYGKKEEKEKSK